VSIQIEAGMSESAQRRWIEQETSRLMKGKYISVYLIGNIERNMFKIGVSCNPTKRIKQLNAPFELTLLAELLIDKQDGPSLLKRARAIEKKLHTFYARKRCRLRNEWFQNIDPLECDLKMSEFSDYSDYMEGAHSDLIPMEAQ
jgi:hypothetical protein